jgi:hypothetical protein
MRLVLLISLFAIAVQADPITVIQTRSASGATDLFFSYDVPTSSGPVTATIRGSAGCSVTLGQCDPNATNATAAIDLTMNLYTAGPMRDGVALLLLSLDSDGSAGGTPRTSGAIGPYPLDSCAKSLHCQIFGYFPFELGAPFTINLSGSALAFPPQGDAEFLASASLQLFEVPPPDGGPAGAPVQIYLVPEPSSARLAGTGISALILFAFRRRRNLRPLR